MTKISSAVKNRLLTIIKDDYEECEFFLAATHLLINKIKTVSEMIQDNSTDFTALRDNLGEVGIFISNTEKRLEEVEDCYNKMIEALKRD